MATQTHRLRDDAPNDLAYMLDFPDVGLVTLSKAQKGTGRTVITTEEFRVLYMERVGPSDG